MKWFLTLFPILILLIISCEEIPSEPHLANPGIAGPGIWIPFGLNPSDAGVMKVSFTGETMVCVYCGRSCDLQVNHGTKDIWCPADIDDTHGLFKRFSDTGEWMDTFDPDSDYGLKDLLAVNSNTGGMWYETYGFGTPGYASTDIINRLDSDGTISSRVGEYNEILMDSDCYDSEDTLWTYGSNSYRILIINHDMKIVYEEGWIADAIFTVDQSNGDCWVKCLQLKPYSSIGHPFLYKYDKYGNRIMSIDGKQIRYIKTSRNGDYLYLTANDNRLYKYDRGFSQIWGVDIVPGIYYFDVAGDDSVWLGKDNELMHYSADGVYLGSIFLKMQAGAFVISD